MSTKSSTKQKHIKNKTTIDHNDDLFKHVKDILRKQGQQINRIRITLYVT